MPIAANEMPAWKRASAYVIMKKAEHIGTIYYAHPLNGDGKLVATFIQQPAAARRCGANEKNPYRYQHGSAGGGGYDKRAAAISGFIIDGHAMTAPDVKKTPRGSKIWHRDLSPPRGWYRSEYCADAGGFTACRRHEGLTYLAAIGYTIISVA